MTSLFREGPPLVTTASAAVNEQPDAAAASPAVYSGQQLTIKNEGSTTRDFLGITQTSTQENRGALMHSSSSL